MMPGQVNDVAAQVERETTLIRQAQAGAAQAFTTLLNRYDRYLYRVTLNITGHREDAEDATQNAFLKAYTRLGQFQGDSRLSTWLVRIAVNEALMVLRRRRWGRFVSLDELALLDNHDLVPRPIQHQEPDPEQEYARSELQRMLIRAVDDLPSIYRVVFLLCEVGQLSAEQTAKMLKLSVPAVKSRLIRARLRLRKQMTPSLERRRKARYRP